MDNRSQIVVMGGSFDPVHNGHLIVARSVAEHFGFPRITLMPAGQAPHKRNGSQATAEDRLAMLRLATVGEELFEVSDLELGRSGPSYTIDTLKTLRELHGQAVEIGWVVGMDMLADLKHWRQAREVASQARIITAARAPWQRELDGILCAMADTFTPEQIERFRSDVAPTPIIEISSSDIRRRVAAGLSVRYMVPPGVLEYIAQRGLYRPDPSL